MKKKFALIPASYLVLFQGSKILLLRRYQTGYHDGEYSFIAGHVEGDESFREAIRREAQEEAGITVAIENLELIHAIHRSRIGNDGERIDLFFTAKQWQGEIKNMEPEKCDDLSWFDLNKLPDNIIPYIKQVIEAIQQKKVYSESGFELIPR